MTISEAQVILGLSPTFTPHELKQAYRRTASANHPDRGGSTERMVMVNEAYALLSSVGNFDGEYQETVYPADSEHPSERYVRGASMVLAGMWWITGMFDLLDQPRRLRSWMFIGFPFAYLIVWALLRWTVRSAIHLYKFARHQIS